MAHSARTLHADLLGRPQLRWNRAPLTLAAVKPRALVYVLAVRREPVAKATLAELLWGPDRLGNLRSALYTLRKQAQAEAWLHEADGGRALQVEVRTDLAVFEHAAVHGDVAEALACWRRAGVSGPAGKALLEGTYVPAAPAFEDWLALERARVAVVYRECLSRRAAELEGAGRWGEARAVLEELVLEDPLHEETYRRLMLACWRLGRVDAALAHFEACRRALAEELGLEPVSATHELYESLRAHAGGSVPDGAAVDADGGAPGFVGRRAELEALDDALRRHRVVTVVGPGGVGKTRLAREAMRRGGVATSRAICFVSLGTLGSGAFVVAAIANALRVGFEGPRDPLAQLGAALRQRPTLLVLDEVEHLPEVDAIVASLLEAAPEITFLITSRRTLRRIGGAVLRLEGLDRPTGPDDPEARTRDAVRMFVSAAQRVDPDFVLTAAVVPAVVRVCEMLRGHPLGLELAAGWLRFHDADALAELLRSDPLRLENPGLPLEERHASLRRVMERSWALLSEEERRVTSELSVCRDGVDAAAAHAIAGAQPRTLLDLVGKSWLKPGPEGRYELHPLVREFGRTQLAARRDVEAVAAAHARVYLGRLAEQRAHVLGRRPGPVLDAITNDFENVREAWRTAVRQRRWEVLRGAAETLSLYADMRARFHDAVALFSEAAAGAASDPDVDAVSRAVLAVGKGTHLFRLSRFGEALALTDALGAASSAEVGAETRLQVLELRANVFVRMGRYPEAQCLYEDALALARTDVPDRLSRELRALANVEAALGHAADAEAHYREAIALNRREGYLVGLAIDLNNLAELLIHQDRLDEADAMIRESRTYADGVDVHLVTYLTLNAAVLGYRRGDVAAAAAHAHACRVQAERFGQVGLQCRSATLLGWAALQDGDEARAAAWLADAVATAHAADELACLMHAFLGWAELLHARGEVTQAARYLACVQDHPASEAEDRAAAARRLESLGLPEHAPTLVELVERIASN